MSENGSDARPPGSDDRGILEVCRREERRRQRRRRAIIAQFRLYIVALLLSLFITTCQLEKAEIDVDGDGYTLSQGDCDDSDATLYPFAEEICDGKDNDCDGHYDEMAEPDPSRIEIPDGIDNDCDGTVDEGTYYYDDDGDGYREFDGDCNDSEPSINPGAEETCADGIDENCDGSLCCEWSATFGEAGYDDIAYSVQQTIDGDYIVAGATESYGSGMSDIYLLKIDQFGNEVWSKTFGGEDEDYAIKVEQVEDGGFILLGYSESYTSYGSSIYFIKTDESGNEEWSWNFDYYYRCYYDEPYTAFETDDRGYIIFGQGDYYNPDIGYDPCIEFLWIIKMDEDGNIEWETTPDDGYYIDINDAKQAGDGGYITVGEDYDYVYDDYDLRLVKFDSYGEWEWERYFGGQEDDIGYSIIPTGDGGYITSGSTSSYCSSGYGCMWLLKTDEYGEEEWSKSYETRGGAYSFQMDIDGGYILAGSGDSKASLLKTDWKGDTLWQRQYGYEVEALYSVGLTDDGGYILSGAEEESDTSWRDDLWVNKSCPPPDEDGDGHYSENLYGGTDCDDSDRMTYTGAEEIEDASDNDCDGIIDNHLDSYDDDADGVTENNGDCNDADPLVYPGAEEGCDNSDNDCDGTIDEGCDYSDSDGDGFSPAYGDCDDSDPDIYPGAPETCNDGIDQDCNGFDLLCCEAEWEIVLEASGTDYVSSVHTTVDGHFVVGGYLRGLWVQKMDEYGNEEWSQTYGDGWLSAVRETDDGGYIVIASANYDFLLLKIDEDGDEEWRQSFGGTSSESALDGVQTSDGGYIMAGYTSSYGAGMSDLWIVKTDEYGNEEWNRTFGGSNMETAYSVRETYPGGYIVAGYTSSYAAGSSDAWLIKIDEYGDEEWNQTLGGSGSTYGFAYSVRQTDDGGYSVGGTNGDFWLVKTDSYGNVEWERTYGGVALDIAYAMTLTYDGGYLLGGETQSYGSGGRDFLVVKTDEDGNEEWREVLGGVDEDVLSGLDEAADGGYLLGGYTGGTVYYGDEDAWLIKICPP